MKAIIAVTGLGGSAFMDENNTALNAQNRKISAWEFRQVLQEMEYSCRSGQNHSKLQNEFLNDVIDEKPVQIQSNTISPVIEKQVIAAAFEHPSWAYNRISNYLRLNGTAVSASAVQMVYIRNGLDSVKDICNKLEQKLFSDKIQLTDEQIEQIEKNNPCFRERHTKPDRPGEILHQETFYAGFYKGIGKVYLHAVVDVFGAYAFGSLNNYKKAEHAAVVLYNEVLPFYHAHNLKVCAIYTDKGAEFHGSSCHPYELYLTLNKIEHRAGRDATRVNGFLERFCHTAMNEFFRTMQEKEYNSIESLQADFDSWLTYYNKQRPNNGYPNWGQPPYNIIADFLNNI